MWTMAGRIETEVKKLQNKWYKAKVYYLLFPSSNPQLWHEGKLDWKLCNQVQTGGGGRVCGNNRKPLF